MTEEKSTEEAKEEVTELEKSEPTGTEYLDFDDLPDDVRKVVEPRFNRIYHNMKDWEKKAGAAIEFSHGIKEQLDSLQEKQTASSKQEQLSKIQEKLKQAKEEGDVDREVDLQTQLSVLAASPGEKTETVDLPAQEPSYDQQAMQTWAGETNADGSLKRPWAREGHPRFRQVAALGNSILYDPKNENEPIESVLAQVDRAMSSPSSPNVIDPSDNSGGSSNKSPKLSSEERFVAGKMGMKPEEYAAFKVK